ncbi:MAG: hypothetical protein H0W62_01850 [Chitinophagales bacterium]|nr:hypothetical protein [Chitinophagales bacterium]
MQKTALAVTAKNDGNTVNPKINGVDLTTVEVQETKAPEPAKVVAIKPEVKINNTENKIQHIIGIGQKIRRRTEVAQAKANLENFILKNEDDSGSLTFEDTNRKRFASSDPDLMKKVQKTIIAACDEEIQKLNLQINEFSC